LNKAALETGWRSRHTRTMPEKRPKRPRDPAQLAKLMIDIASGEVADTTGKVPNRARGGRKGGNARARSLTPKQRSEIARAASAARWKKGAKRP